MLILKKCNLTGLLFSFLIGILPIQATFAVNFGKISPDNVAVYVSDLETGQIIYQHRADASVSPASTMKLITSFVALQQLGSQYRWHTEWRSDAPIIDGQLQGNLYWQGSGNPVFDQTDLQNMQTQLQLNGINQINGQLVLDRSIWSNITTAKDFIADQNEVFVTPPDPHMTAFRVLWLTVTQNSNGQPTFTINPPLPDITIRQQSNWLHKNISCPSVEKFIHTTFNGHKLTIQGNLPTSCLNKKWFINANKISASEFAAQSFRAWWRINNADINYTIGTIPSETALLATHDSKTLAEIITDMNKYSNNTIARTIFLRLGETENSDTVQSAINIIKQTLQQAKINPSSLVLENGSGLSRKERLSARLLGQLLHTAYHAPFAQDFINSLPIGGIDGTLKKRFRNTHGQWHLKTGTLANVNALAGYWFPQTRGQHPLVIVAIINAPNSNITDLDILVHSLTRQ